MKKILIIGGSKGIGNICLNYFNNLNYDVLSVSRSEGTFIGDITNNNFRKELVENTSNVDIVINSAGSIGFPISQSINLNYNSVLDLFFQYYLKLKPGSQLINISSIAATYSKGTLGNTFERISYSTSKNAISEGCLGLSKSRVRDIRVTTLEPEYVIPTNISDFHKKNIDNEVYENYNFNSFTPIQPIYIAEIINWIIQQPRWINISRITIGNQFSFKVNG